MKINSKTQFGIRFVEDPAFYESVISDNMDHELNQDMPTNDVEKLIHKQMLLRMLNKTGFQEYLITRTVQEMVEKIKLPKDLRVFNSVTRINRTFLIDESQFYRYMFEGDILRCIYVFYLKERDTIAYTMFSLNLSTGKISCNDNTFIKENSLLFLKLLTFVEFADLEVKFIQPGQKIGDKHKGFKNESHRKVIIVDSNWNKYVIRMEGFPVSGHFRFQPYGEGNSLRKYIWIDGYEKTGYFRNPKKDNS